MPDIFQIMQGDNFADSQWQSIDSDKSAPYLEQTKNCFCKHVTLHAHDITT